MLLTNMQKQQTQRRFEVARLGRMEVRQSFEAKRGFWHLGEFNAFREMRQGVGVQHVGLEIAVVKWLVKTWFVR